MMTTKNGLTAYYKLINQIRGHKVHTPKKRPHIAQGIKLFDTGDSKKIPDPKLSKFYKAMDLAG